MKKFCIATVSFVLLMVPVSCTTKPDDKKPAATQPATSQPNASAKPADTGNGAPAVATVTVPAGKQDTSAKEYQLIFKELADKDGYPYWGAYLSENGKLSLIKSFIAASCSDFDKSEYKDRQVPASAINAGGGWYAGAGSYFYLVLKNGEPVVYEGWQEEEQTDKGYHWQPVKLKKP